MALALIESRTINNTLVDGFYNDKDAWFTRKHIGEALGYDDPVKAIGVIHSRHRERLDLFSRVLQFDTPSGAQEGYMYSFRGVLEICRWSRQPNADMVMDALYDMAESVKTKGYFSTMADEELLTHLALKVLDGGKPITATAIREKAQEILTEERAIASETMVDYLGRRDEILSKYKQNPELCGCLDELKALSGQVNQEKTEKFRHISIPELSCIQRQVK